VEQAALNALSAYFQVQVTSRAELAESYAEENGAASQSLRLDLQTLALTETELFAVRYTDPWQNPNTGAWEIAAYMDRNEAWDLFEPRLVSSTAPFMAMFQAAEADTEPLRRFFRYRTARDFDPSGLTAYLNFARLLSPDRAAGFSAVGKAIAELPQRLDKARFEAALFVDCPVDLDGLIATALTAALSAQGFPVTGDRNAAAAVCRASLEEGQEKREGGMFYTPKLTVMIAGSSGDPLVSMIIQGPRQSAINPDLAKRRAYTALAGAIPAQFTTEFEKQISTHSN
jgi:hypothetical protein